MHFEKNNDSSQTITASALGPNTILRSEASEATLSVRADHDAAPKSALRSEASEATLSVRADLDAADNKSVDTDPEQAQPLAPVVVEEPPDGGYGWVCVLSVFLINAHTWGINGSYGIFLAHYLKTNSFPGATDLDFAFVGGLSLSMAQFIAPVATITTREWGTKATLAIGIVLQSGALLAASWSTEIWHLFLSQAVCFGFGMGMQFSSTVGIIPQWFNRRRSLANGIATAGSGIGGLIYSLATGAMIQNLGTGWAFRILAIASAAACGFATIIVKDRNKAIGAVQNPFHATLLKRPEFLLTLAWGAFSVLGYVALLFSIPSYAHTVGLTTSQGSILGALFNLGGAFGRPLMGYVSDASGRINTALVCTFLAGLTSFVIWIFAKSFGVLIFYALIGGALAPTFTTTVAPVGTEVVGLKLLPSALSIFWLSSVIPSTFAEAIALWLRTDNGTNYLHAQIFTGFMFMGASLCLWLVRAWKIADLQRTADDVDPIKQESESGNKGPNATSIELAAKGLFKMKIV